jgi:hypothetical protein
LTLFSVSAAVADTKVARAATAHTTTTTHMVVVVVSSSSSPAAVKTTLWELGEGL